MDLAAFPVVDGHCHPLLVDPWALDPDAVCDLLTEARPGTMAAHVPHTGLFRRALDDLARQLGVERTLAGVLERRRALGPAAAGRLLAERRVAALLVDTGYPPDAMSLAEMRRLLPCRIEEIVRIETCAERLLVEGLAWPDFLAAVRAELTAAARRCVAFKTIIAYRSGLAVRRWRPDEAAAAYREALARHRDGGPVRLTEQPLLDTLVEVTLEIARETGRPLQVHAGFGDPDIDLLQANPLLLRPLLEDPRWADVRLVILHAAYPYFREAAFMTAVWPQVYLDLSLALPFLGRGMVGPLIEVLSLAPATKLLYGSDLRGLPELFAVAADWARATLGEALAWIAEREGWPEGRVAASARQILSANASALYGLGPTSGESSITSPR